jgi:hypothetical protein
MLAFGVAVLLIWSFRRGIDEAMNTAKQRANLKVKKLAVRLLLLTTIGLALAAFGAVLSIHPIALA